MKQLRTTILSVLTAGLFLANPCLYAGQYLETLDDMTVHPYQMDAQLGVDVEEQIDESTLIAGPTMDISFGIGEWADLGINYEVLTLSDSPEFDDGTGSGDFRIRLKAVPFQTDWGNLGFAVISKIPSADDGEGLGTDEADIVLKAIWGSHAFGDLHLFVNLGVAIQGDPRSNASQDDFFIWGIGAKYPLPSVEGSTWSKGLWLVGEFEGSVGPEDNSNVSLGEFTDADTEFRAGLVKELPWFNAALSGSLGISDDSPDWGFRISLSRTFDLPSMTKE